MVAPVAQPQRPRQQPQQQQATRNSTGGNAQAPRSSGPGPTRHRQSEGIPMAAPPAQRAPPSAQQPQQQQQQSRSAYQQPRAAVPAQQSYAAPMQQSSPTPNYDDDGDELDPPSTTSAPAPAKKSVFDTMKGGMNSVKGSVFSKLGVGKDSNTAGEGVPAGVDPQDDLAVREANLRAREEKILAAQMEVEQRERAIKIKEGAVNNWPSRCYPVLYHSISDEIPLTLQSMVKKLYFTLFLTWTCLVWNVVTCCTEWGETGDGGTDPIWSVVWVLLGCPGAWHVWYKPVYDAAKGGASRKYLLFFCGFGMHLLFMLYLGIGTPSSGAGGLLVMIKEYAKGYPITGTFSLIDTALFGLNFLLSVYLLKKAHSAWKTGGGSEALAKDRAKLKLASKAGLAAV